ncbi:MAG: hypothetical protein WC184_10915 [Acidimicrobiia bacterium]
MSEPKTPAFVTFRVAAELCGCDISTIRRANKAEKLPNTRKNKSGAWEVPLADLVAAGMLDPLASNTDVAEILGRSRNERDLVMARQDLALANAEIEALKESLSRSDDEIAFMRGLLTKAAA